MKRSRIVLAVIMLWLAPVGAVGQIPGGSDDLVQAAIERTTHDVTYDGSYRRLDYPGGDVPDQIGVCTDVVVRAYRAIGFDFQRLVHEDMVVAFESYPQLWGAQKADSNIDHRRVPNLQTFLQREGAELPASDVAADYLPGDLVTWMLADNLPHIGIVVDQRSIDGLRPQVVHNIGAGPEMEDVLFQYPVTGHYRYMGPRQTGEAE